MKTNYHYGIFNRTLVKEIESALSEEPEEFITGKPAGYGITGIKSTGLDSYYVKGWLLRKFAVFFAPKYATQSKGGQQVTPITKDLKLFYIRFILNQEEVKEPKILIGVFYDIISKRDAEKFEIFMSHMEYIENKFFKTPSAIDYEDLYIKIKGELLSINLFDITDSMSIRNKLLEPALEIYRKIR